MKNDMQSNPFEPSDLPAANPNILKTEFDDLVEKINDTFTEIFERIERLEKLVEKMETEMRKAAWIE